MSYSILDLLSEGEAQRFFIRSSLLKQTNEQKKKEHFRRCGGYYNFIKKMKAVENENLGNK